MPPQNQRLLLADSGVVSAYLSENQKYRELRNEIARHFDGRKLCSCSVVEGELFVWADRLGPRRYLNFEAFFEDLSSFPVTTATAKCYADKVWLRVRLQAPLWWLDIYFLINGGIEQIQIVARTVLERISVKG